MHPKTQSSSLEVQILGERGIPLAGDKEGEQLPASTTLSRVCDPAPRLSHTPVSPAGNKTAARSLGADHLLTKSQKEKKKKKAQSHPKQILRLLKPLFSQPGGVGGLCWSSPAACLVAWDGAGCFWGGFCHCFTRDVCSGCRAGGVKAPEHGSAKLGTPRTHGNLQGCALPVGQRQNFSGNFAL